MFQWKNRQRIKSPANPGRPLTPFLWPLRQRDSLIQHHPIPKPATLPPIYSYKTWSFQSYVKLPEGNVGLKVVQTRFVLALVVSTHLNLRNKNC
jgi:hypothetical protein